MKKTQKKVQLGFKRGFEQAVSIYIISYAEIHEIKGFLRIIRVKIEEAL